MRDLDRRTVLQLLGLSALALQLSGCAAGDANLAISGVGRAPKGEPIRSTLSTFAAGLLDRMPDGNVVVSPVSIAVVLAMLANGASTIDSGEALVALALPKFHAEFGQSLREVLTGLGLVDAWTDGDADFSGITGDRSLHLGFVQHKAVVTVDETGAEAAAVTAGGAEASSLTVPQTFHADRPFLWAIVHVPTKAIVMLGREDDPTL